MSGGLEGPVDGEAIRGGALGVLRADTPAAVRDAVERGWIEVRDTAKWEASSGTVGALRVALGLDVSTLHEIECVPWYRDALVDAFTRAVIARPGCSLYALHTYWAYSSRVPGTGYRESAAVEAEASLDDPDAVRVALLDWLDRDEDAAVRSLVERSTLAIELEPEHRELVIRAERRVFTAWRDYDHPLFEVRDAAKALLRGRENARVTVRLERG